MRKQKLILGIWDGHDAGAALIQNDEVVFAINEERLSRRKLEIGFPTRSIATCFKYLNLDPADIDVVATSTSDFAKTLTRCFPSARERYYLLRRRKTAPGFSNRFIKLAKYKLTEWPPSALTRAVSKMVLKGCLKGVGLNRSGVSLIDHHSAHAATAAFCSGFSECLVLTIDGIGDGLSGSVRSFRNGKFEHLVPLSGKASCGVFFEHVTNLMNMRELEDEGKVMALANYAYPIPDRENPMLDFLLVDGMTLSARYSSTRMYRELASILWRYPAEQFAYMAQRTLENRVVELVKNALQETAHSNLAYAGGVASNVKVNMLIRELPQIRNLFIFPHMGDGGLALGAAMWANYEKSAICAYDVPNVYWGPAFSDASIEQALQNHPSLDFTRMPDTAKKTADLLSTGEIIMWFQGRMEYGPRALGSRSILALPNSTELKDLLNLKLKKRVWYQPFCPTMLHEDAVECLEGYSGPPNQFMTCAYRTRKEKRRLLQGVINVDGSCRPQILYESGTDVYTSLLKEMKKNTGLGVVLNTSFNLHGEPIVCTPEEALKTFACTDINFMVMNNYLMSKK